MKDYYKLLEIDNTNINTNIKCIQKAYKNKIKCFYDLPFLTKKMIHEIKDLKEAYYVLSNNYRKDRYNKIIINKTSDDINNTKICDRIFSLSFK